MIYVEEMDIYFENHTKHTSVAHCADKMHSSYQYSRWYL